MSKAKKKRNTVSKKTFLKWECHADFDAVIDDDGDIETLTCKICVKYADQIRVEARGRKLKGQVLESILSYAKGVTYVHKTNVSNHVKSDSLHNWAKQKFETKNATETSSDKETAEKPATTKKRWVNSQYSACTIQPAKTI